MAGTATAAVVCSACIALGVCTAGAVHGQQLPRQVRTFDVRDLHLRQPDELVACAAAIQRIASDEFGGRTSVRFEDQGYLLVGGEAPAESWVTDLLSRCRGQDLPGLHFEVSIVRLPGAAAKELKLLEHPRLQQTPPQAAVLMQRLLKADKARLINLPPIATAPMVALRIDHPGKVQKDKPTVESPLHLLCMAFPCADGAMAVDVRLEASSLLVNAAGQLPPGQVLMQAQALGDVVWILQVRSREEPPKKQRHARSRGPRLRRRR